MVLEEVLVVLIKDKHSVQLGVPIIVVALVLR
jgi:hypothetical protein